MSHFYEEVRDIYRLRIPYGTVYTSVFLIRSPSGAILVDCAATSEDVDERILPALRELGYSPSDLGMLVLTHTHRDHAGGRARLWELAPGIEIVRDVRELSDGICTYPLAGHTEDHIGVLDIRTHTLLSGDGLQGAGVDKYRCSLRNPAAYAETVRRVMNDKRIENVLFSHAYEPWNSDRAMGREAVEHCLSECKTDGKTERKKEHESDIGK